MNLQLQLKKTQDANSELVLAVQDLNEMLEQKNREIYSLSNKHEEGKNSHEFAGKLSNCETDEEEQKRKKEQYIKNVSYAYRFDIST